MFFAGSLQEGIALAVSEAKAVICFVRDDGETSTKWEEEYFQDEELKQTLATKAITLRLTKDTQEAGFLTSFCPVTGFPAVVVIKQGSLREYIVPEISKDDFCSRLSTAIEEIGSPGQPAATPQGDTASQSTTSAAAAPAPEPQTASASIPTRPEVQQPPPKPRSAPTPAQATTTQPSEAPSQPQASVPKPEPKKSKPAAEPKIQPKQETKPKESTPKPKINIAKRQPAVETASEPTEPQPKPPPSPPKEYRLQVRLFDGSSVRSSFTPTQTISGAVRPWIDSQPTEEKRPYNLKHILTPLPNRTLTIAEEEQTLEELGLGSTANLVMVPINTYTEAYSSATSSLPVRAVSSAYGLVSSAAGIATGLVGSLFGYGQTPPAPSEATPTAGTPDGSGSSTPRPRPGGNRGPIIRTLRDQREGQDDRQFYNGNQLNFQPRGNNE